MIFTYNYKIITNGNQIVEGTIRAYMRMHAEYLLQKKGGTILALKNIHNPLSAISISFGFSPLEKIVFFSNLSMMIDAGLTLSIALDVLEEQARGMGIKRAIAITREGVLNGKPLSTMLSKFPRFFSPYIIETIKVGEIGGTLSATLEQIAEDLEEDYELRRKVVAAMIYPVIIFIVMFSVLMLLSTYVLPKIAELFSELDAPLPAITRFVLGISGFIAAHPIATVSVVVAVPTGLLLMTKNEFGRRFVDALTLRLPFFGMLIKEYNLAQFFRSLSTLQKNGVSLEQSVGVSLKTLNNVIYKNALESSRNVLLFGAPLSDGLALYPSIFPQQTVQIVKIGEQTGRLSDSFAKLCQYYTRTVSHKTKMLTSVIEPIMIVLAGILIGGIALSIFYPLYQVAEVI